VCWIRSGCQDFATLDLVSHGRAEIIAGRSAFAEPFALFGEDITQLDDLYAEKLDLLLRLRNEDRVTWTGRFRPPLRDAAPNPQPVGPLPIWVAVGSTAASAQRAGRLGLPMALGLIGGTIDHAKRLIDLYRTAGVTPATPTSSWPSVSPATSTSARPKSRRLATSTRTTTATCPRRPTAAADGMSTARR
jgi:alkanesulfonate monooxygenase SsuD/methylene tetrahydromethanopterin reductase-like flavin-dependent oxidoreductase (luciferase family)